MSGNSPNYREIEKKFRLTNTTLERAGDHIIMELALRHIPAARWLNCQTNDHYWVIGGTQFVRLRDSWGKSHNGFSHVTREVTTKAKDRGDNTDRLEINLSINDCQQGLSLLTALAGEPLGQIRKNEFVVWTEDGCVISVAKIGEDLFLEVEGGSEALIDGYIGWLQREFILEREPRSLFEIYVEKVK